MTAAALEAAAARLRRGQPVVVHGGAGRNDEGDVVFAASLVTAETIDFVARTAGGIMRLVLSPARCEALGLVLKPMRGAREGAELLTATIDAAVGVSGGRSAGDRAHTVRVAGSERATIGDVVQPGRVLTVQARAAGVLEREGHAEAAVDLARIAGLPPAVLLCEVLLHEGSEPCAAGLRGYCASHDLAMVATSDVVAHRWSTERLVERIAEARLPTEFGELEVVGYQSLLDQGQHVAAVLGDVRAERETLVHVHSACFLGDVAMSDSCRAGRDLRAALAEMADRGSGVVVYVTDERTRLAGLGRCPRGCHGEPLGDDVPQYPAHGLGEQILRDLGVVRMRRFQGAADHERASV